jgi:hypothetical protein
MIAFQSMAYMLVILALPFIVIWGITWILLPKFKKHRQTLLFLGNALAVLMFIGLGSWLRSIGYIDIFKPAMAVLLFNVPLAIFVSRRGRQDSEK